MILSGNFGRGLLNLSIMLNEVVFTILAKLVGTLSFISSLHDAQCENPYVIYHQMKSDYQTREYCGCEEFQGSVIPFIVVY